jgi:hypothetical protein
VILEDITGRLVYPARIENIEIVKSYEARQWANLKPDEATHAIIVTGETSHEDYDGQDNYRRTITDTESVVGWYDSEESAKAALDAFLSTVVVRKEQWGGILSKEASE